MIDIIEKHFADVAIKRNNIILYYPADAIKVINKCKELNRAILGIDAFKIYEDNTIQPFMEHSIDYSEEKNIVCSS